MVAGLQFVRAKSALLIGLGGGGLCTFISHVFKCKQTAVELDPAILQIATEFFGLVQSKNLAVQIQDGLEYLKTTAATDHFDAVMFDVDSKDTSVGMSCPPEAFVGEEILQIVSRLIGETGIFILNLVCRDEALRESVMSTLKSHFVAISSYKLDEDLNEVVYCRTSTTDWTRIERSVKDLNQAMRKQKIPQDEMLDVENFMKTLQIV